MKIIVIFFAIAYIIYICKVINKAKSEVKQLQNQCDNLSDCVIINKVRIVEKNDGEFVVAYIGSLVWGQVQLYNGSR